MIESVKQLLEQGFHVIPCNKDKTPAGISWKKYMIEKPDIKIFNKVFDSIGILGGRGLEILDIDTKYHNGEHIYNSFKTLIADNVYHDFLVIKTPSGGYHYYYYTDVSEGNLKLANNLAKEVLFETRGNNGYVLCPPSKGYSIISGSFDKIPRISKTDRDCLFQICKSFNQVEKKINVDLKNCFDEFNQKGDVISILRNHGWSVESENSDIIYLTRPGKKTGISASFNKRINVFYVFTSSTEFSSDKGYNPASVFIKLEANGDTDRAKEMLIEKGYGQKEYVKPPVASDKKAEEQTEPAEKVPVITLVENYLNKKYEFRKNIINQRIEFRKVGTDEILTRINLASLWRELQKKKLNFRIDSLKNLLQSDFVNEYDHFKYHFESLKNNGTGHIDKLASFVHTTEPEFWKIMFKKALVRSIACSLYGIENRIVVTLSGEKQGTGKSTFIRFLNPFGNDYYTESPLRTDKDTQFRFAECFIYNLEELQALNNKDIEALKTIISQSIVRERKPFAIDEQTMMRRCNFWASTNKDNFLNDTENTRWLIFTINKIDWKYKKEIDINDVWAEAYEMYQQGYNYNLTSDEESKRELFNKGYEIVTNERDLVIKYFRIPSPDDINSVFITNAEIINTLLADFPRIKINSVQIGRTMGQLGFKSTTKKINGLAQRGYVVIHSNNHDTDPNTGIYKKDEENIINDKIPF